MTRPARLDDWRRRLAQWMADCPRQPLAYGRHDCALFAASAVHAMTGHDFAAPYRGRYTTLRGGLRVLRAAGFEDHVALARHCLPVIPAAFAAPGDLAVIPTGDPLPALGVVQGAAVFVLTPEGAIGLVPLTHAIEALRV